MDFKSEILATSRNLGLTQEEFDSVGIYESPEIMKKIETNFVIKRSSNTKFNWWWEDVKSRFMITIFQKTSLLWLCNKHKY